MGSWSWGGQSRGGDARRRAAIWEDPLRPQRSFGNLTYRYGGPRPGSTDILVAPLFARILHPRAEKYE